MHPRDAMANHRFLSRVLPRGQPACASQRIGAVRLFLFSLQSPREIGNTRHILPPHGSTSTTVLIIFPSLSIMLAAPGGRDSPPVGALVTTRAVMLAAPGRRDSFPHSNECAYGDAAQAPHFLLFGVLQHCNYVILDRCGKPSCGHPHGLLSENVEHGSLEPDMLA